MSSLTRLPDALEMLALHGAVDAALHTLQMYPDDQGWYRRTLGPLAVCRLSLIPFSGFKVERITIVTFLF